MIRPLQTAESQFRVVERDSLGEGLCDQLSAYWFRMFDETGSVPPRSRFEPSEVTHLLPRILLMDVLEDGDIRYRLLGTDVDQLTRRPYTGLRVSEIPEQGPESRIRRLYTIVLDRMCPVLVKLPYVGPSALCESVKQVAMPLMLPDGSVQLLSLVDFNLRSDVGPREFLGDHSRRA